MTNIFLKRTWLAIVFLCLSTAAFADKLDDTRKAALQGDAEAQFNLGVAYDKGVGVPRNNREAYIWYSLAVASGSSNKNATIYRDEVEQKLSLAKQSEAQEEAERRWEEISVRQANPVTKRVIKEVPPRHSLQNTVNNCSIVSHSRPELAGNFTKTYATCLRNNFVYQGYLQNVKKGTMDSIDGEGIEFLEECVLDFIPSPGSSEAEISPKVDGLAACLMDKIKERKAEEEIIFGFNSPANRFIQSVESLAGVY